MTAILITTTALLANLLGAVMALPQAWKLVRTRRAEGLSPAWAGVSVGMNVWWLAYGLAESLWALVPVSAMSILLYGSMAGVFGRAGGRAAVGVVRGLAIAGLAPLPFLLVGGWTVAGVAIGFGYGAQLAPAVVAAYREHDLSGVAAGTWVIALIEGALWLVYGALVGDPALLIGGIAGGLMASLILARLATTGFLVIPALRKAS